MPYSHGKSSDGTNDESKKLTPSLSIELRITTIFLTQAMMATFLGLPAASNRS